MRSHKNYFERAHFSTKTSTSKKIYMQYICDTFPENYKQTIKSFVYKYL